MGPFFILLVYVSTAGEKLDFFSGAGAGDAFLTELGRRAGGDALLPLLSKGFSQNEEDNRLKSRYRRFLAPVLEADVVDLPMAELFFVSPMYVGRQVAIQHAKIENPCKIHTDRRICSLFGWTDTSMRLFVGSIQVRAGQPCASASAYIYIYLYDMHFQQFCL